MTVTTNAAVTGVVSPSNQVITGGSIDGTSIGATTPAAGAFTTLMATSIALAGGTALGNYVEGTWVPVFTGLTVTLGGGTEEATGAYIRIGNFVIANVLIAVTGGASTTSVAGTTNFTLPIASSRSAAGNCGAVNQGSIVNYGLGAVSNGSAFPPSWTTVTNGILISCIYLL